jgi:hypothetical protein
MKSEGEIPCALLPSVEIRLRDAIVYAAMLAGDGDAAIEV